jgi:hypothetical protein
MDHLDLLVVGDDLAGEDQLHDVHVADVHRLVEAPLVADVGKRRRGREAAGKVQLRMGDGGEDQEGEDRDRDQHREHRHEAADDEAGHQRLSSCARSKPGVSAGRATSARA